MRYPNTILGKWEATKPLEIVVSDMTILKHRGKSYEWTFLLDTFDNSIISSHVSGRAGDIRTYHKCLNDLKTLTKEKTTPTVLHTDQGAVYSSVAYNNGLSNYNIKRSMSRAGTPTDNPIIESINGWIKEEIYSDFDIDKEGSVEQFLKKFVVYFNTERPAYALGYLTPRQYRNASGFP
jgi:transposase InsO family protein